ncbi:MAG: hypothetical protein LBG66_02055 [Gallionellaceae bacterium]|jgi:uncharacterized membrane protein|nr:hypothetical protein [Gallionellaceae bacterium]
MDGQTTRIVTYITLIGFIIAMVAGTDKENPLTKFHLNQSLVIHIGGIIAAVLAAVIASIIPSVGGIVGTVLGLLLLAGLVIGLIGAIQGVEKQVPLIGGIKLLN